MPSPADRRVALVEPTEEGRTTFLRAAAVHARVVERFFVRPPAAADYTRLTGVLGEIDKVLREGTG